MKTVDYNRPLETQFAPETRFAVVPAPVAPFRALAETELERLKTRLLYGALQASGDPESYASLRRAANDAAALAWATNYPLLLFPGLFEEKAMAAAGQTARQARIRQRSRSLLEAAL
jgi:hypothetical protein